MKNPFRYFKTSPEIIRLAVMMYVRFPLSLRHVEDLLHERGIEVSHENDPVLVEPDRPDSSPPRSARSGWIECARFRVGGGTSMKCS